MKGRVDLALVLALALFCVFASMGAFIAYKINECSGPGFVPFGCPIVVQIGK